MAQYTITYTCGHSTVEQIYGKTDGRAAEAERRGSRLCRDCCRAGQQAAAREQAEATGLPALTGSEKQVAWATTLRAQMIADVEQEIARYEQQLARNPRLVETQLEGVTRARTRFATIRRVLHTEDRAAWWIDHRTSVPMTLITAIINQEEHRG